ncbi:MAG: acetyl-CoA carboxylase biotin carboxyl carrier protein [Alphaproteobacteria bacterium]|nr:acetyl-CoA carboxylase biotin carboxyl carrier protein [Alphaproteobacteria bacterium]
MMSFDLDTEFVRKLAELLKETGLNEIEYAEGDKRIRCVAAAPASVVQMAAPAALPVASANSVTASEAKAFDGTVVEAPMVGTVYLSPAPSAAPFIKVGDTVKAGDTLLIIEAMKVMNPIKAPVGGLVKEILVGDAKPVEFGETLVVIG